MRAMRRWVKDESGVALILAILVVAIIGVMGAGLLTFISRDLNGVIRVNQGQKAFEVAEAGVQAAKERLYQDCVVANNTTCMDLYDDIKNDPPDPPTVIGTPDSSPWSAANDGVTLSDVDGDGPGGTSDEANVTIHYDYVIGGFKVLSTGDYDGEAKRKIEAIIEGISGSGGGDGTGHPTYYTPSNIKIEAPFTLSGISLFSEQNILMEGVTPPNTTGTSLKDDHEDRKGGTLQGPAPNDELENWDSTTFPPGTSGTWNTKGRETYPAKSGKKSAYVDPGFAAEGKICSFPKGSTASTCTESDPSVADGVYGYDSTTGPRIPPSGSPLGTCPTSSDPANPTPPPNGNNLTFCSKDPVDKNPNDTGTITYPFPRPVPSVIKLRGYAQTAGKYYKGTSPNWNALMADNTENTVVFIDAEDSDTPLDFTIPTSNPNTKGILVVWCGSLILSEKLQGMSLNLYGDGDGEDGELPGGSSCDNDKGVFRNNGQDFSGWLFAEGGTSTRAGIELGPNSRVSFLPGGNWSFFNDAFSGTPPTSFQVMSWRELYEE